VIIRGGETLSSREIEDYLSSHPGVREAAVVGMKDERYGERICAFVRLAAPGAFTVGDAATHFRALGVAKHKTPEKVVVVDDFPRTAAGKIRKEQLRASLR
jgi:non-ribosomal peptide synthetase component E (peptide arylation enzyme)